MTREEFQKYLDCFNTKDYEGATDYFADDMELQFFTRFTNEPQTVRTVYGKEGFKEHYTKLHAKVNEILDLKVYLENDKDIFVSIYTEFHALEDVIFTAGPMKKGDVFICTNFITYKLDENDKFKLIRVAHWAVHEPKPTQVVIQ